MENEILQQILGKLTSMESDIKDLKTEVKEIKQKIDILEQGQIKLEERQTSLENKLDRVIIQQKENTDFIQAIKYSTEENNAKLEGLALTFAKVEGDTNAISKKLNTIETVTADNWGEINRLKAVKLV